MLRYSSNLILIITLITLTSISHSQKLLANDDTKIITYFSQSRNSSFSKSLLNQIGSEKSDNVFHNSKQNYRSPSKSFVANPVPEPEITIACGVLTSVLVTFKRKRKKT